MDTFTLPLANPLIKLLNNPVDDDKFNKELEPVFPDCCKEEDCIEP
jgi:hypothetical protein